MLDGSCRLSVGRQEPITLQKGDFVLVPAAYDFTTSSLEPPPTGVEPKRVELSPGVFRLDVAQRIRKVASGRY